MGVSPLLKQTHPILWILASASCPLPGVTGTASSQTFGGFCGYRLDCLSAFPTFLGQLSHYHSSKCFPASKMLLFPLSFFLTFAFCFYVLIPQLSFQWSFWKEWRQICVYSQVSQTGNPCNLMYLLKRKDCSTEKAFHVCLTCIESRTCCKLLN